MTMAKARAAIGHAVWAAIAGELARDKQQRLGDIPQPPARIRQARTPARSAASRAAESR
jgi:hypothetical protein